MGVVMGVAPVLVIAGSSFVRKVIKESLRHPRGTSVIYRDPRTGDFVSKTERGDNKIAV